MRCNRSRYQDLCNCHWVFHDKNNNYTFQHVYLHQKISVYQNNENEQSNTINTDTLGAIKSVRISEVSVFI